MNSAASPRRGHLAGEKGLQGTGDQDLFQLVGKGKTGGELPGLQNVITRSERHHATAQLKEVIQRVGMRSPGLVQQSISNPVVQRGIKKTGQGGELYKAAPLSYKGERIPGPIVSGLRQIISNNSKNAKGDDFTLSSAIKYVKESQKAAGPYVVGRPGKKIKTSGGIVHYLKGLGHDTSTLEDKLKKTGPVVDAQLKDLEFVESDFSHVANIGSAPSTVHTGTMHTLNEVGPSLVRTVTGLRTVISDMEKADSHFASSIKGSQFENFVRETIFPGMKRLQIPKQGTMKSKRTADGYDPKTGTVWDMKYYGKNSTIDHNQANDYSLATQKGYVGENGEPINKVKYLFQSKEAAQHHKASLNYPNITVHYATGHTTQKV